MSTSSSLGVKRLPKLHHLLVVGAWIINKEKMKRGWEINTISPLLFPPENQPEANPHHHISIFVSAINISGQIWSACLNPPKLWKRLSFTVQLISAIFSKKPILFNKQIKPFQQPRSYTFSVSSLHDCRLLDLKPRINTFISNQNYVKNVPDSYKCILGLQNKLPYHPSQYTTNQVDWPIIPDSHCNSFLGTKAMKEELNSSSSRIWLSQKQ